MATNRSPKEMVEALYEAIKAKDFATIREVCSPEIDWIQSKGFPGGSRHRGVEEVITNVVQGLGRDWESFVFNPEETIGIADLVVVLGRYRGKHRATGNKMDAVGAHVFNIEDRRIARFRQYADTHSIFIATQAE